MTGSGLGVLLLVLLIGGLVSGEILARLLPRWGYPRSRQTVRLLMVLTAGIYTGALLTVSLTSRERVLARGQTLRFCGFYLDCHLGVAVAGMEERSAIGAIRPEGAFHIVTVRISSDARRATLHLKKPEFTVLDAKGRRYARVPAAEHALAPGPGDSAALVRPIAAGESYRVQVVFDLPRDIAEPRLLVTDPTGIDRVLEAILIGDEDSIFHKPVTLALR